MFDPGYTETISTILDTLKCLERDGVFLEEDVESEIAHFLKRHEESVGEIPMTIKMDEMEEDEQDYEAMDFD